MKRIYQILATGYLALMLFLNIGLPLSMNFGLHAHFLGNNQILIHLHHSQGGEHSHNSCDAGTTSNLIFSTTLTFLNNSERITLRSLCFLLHNDNINSSYRCNYKPHLYNSPLRAPPAA